MSRASFSLPSDVWSVPPKPLLLGYGLLPTPGCFPEYAAFKYESRVCHSGGRNGIPGLLNAEQGPRCRADADSNSGRDRPIHLTSAYSVPFAKNSDSSSMPVLLPLTAFGGTISPIRGSFLHSCVHFVLPDMALPFGFVYRHLRSSPIDLDVFALA